MIFIDKNDFESILNILMDSKNTTKAKAEAEFKRLLKEYNDEDRFMITTRIGIK